MSTNQAFKLLFCKCKTNVLVGILKQVQKHLCYSRIFTFGLTLLSVFL